MCTFLKLNNIPLYICAMCGFFIHSSADGHLGCLHVLAIVHSAAVNNCVHVSFSGMVSRGNMPSSEIAESHDSLSF